MAKSPYKIRLVDGSEEDVAEALHEMHRLTFLGTAPAIDPELGDWWIAYYHDTPVGFINIYRSTYYKNQVGYFNRVGVLSQHRGQRLQGRLMRAMERRARSYGWTAIVSDTTDNPASANSFIRGGYRIFTPVYLWSFSHSVYWWKDLV